MKSSICDNEWLKKDIAPDYHLMPTTIDIVDLFSGCGGLTLGALEACYQHKLGSKVQLAVEYNENAANTYQKNFASHLNELYKGNIEDLITNDPGEPLSKSERNLKKRISNVDILLAGPPCQGHSRLNNHTRSIDPRNKLYLKAIRFAELCKPKFIIIENVLNIKYDTDNILKKSTDFLKSAGYHVKDITVKTVEYGIAQNRVRHIQIASIDDFEITLNKYESTSVLEDVINDIIDNYTESEKMFETPLCN
jgi:DNA (cytosine-5)-methyltransferase 1